MDTSGKLTEEEKQKVISWVKEKMGGVLKCPACGKNSWAVLDSLATTPLFLNGNIQLGGQTYTYVGLICENCAHTMLFNAVRVGIVPPSKMENANG